MKSSSRILSIVAAILGRAKGGSLLAAGAAAVAIGASSVASASVVEEISAPYMTYEVECLGPREIDRDYYCALRERMTQAREQRDLQRYFDLKRQLDKVPLERKWIDGFRNLVTTVGKNDLLTQYFKGSSYTATPFVGLIDNASFTAVAAGDTMASHAGWLEGVPYSNATRPALTLGTASAGSIDNSASKASYTINATATVNGAFVTTVSTKSGTTGTLYSAGSFAGTRSVISGDTLNVQVTLTV